MSYAPQRSLSAELGMGMIDGSTKQWIRERGGQPEYTTQAARRHLSSNLYGFREDNEKVDPFGRIFSTPNFTPGRDLVYPGGWQ